MTIVLKLAGADGVIRLVCAGGAMLEVPIWESHARGTNYLAVIDVDATMPAGLSRRFVNRGRGECYYLTEQLTPGDAVEFAGDYTTSVGKRKRERIYGVIVEKTEEQIAIRVFDTGVLASLAAREFRKERDEAAAVVRIRVE